MNTKINKLLKRFFKHPFISALFLTIVFEIGYLIHRNYFIMRGLPPKPWREVITQKSYWIGTLLFYIFSYINIFVNNPYDEEDDKDDKQPQ